MTRKNFLICGLTGWCMEIIFTSIGSASQHDFRLMGVTSIWMFPIYGLAVLIVPIYQKIRFWPVICRSLLYAICIMAVEYITGSLLSLFGMCPWDYSNAPVSIQGVVRPDYLPFWMAAGLAFERLLCGQGTTNQPLAAVSPRQG